MIAEELLVPDPNSKWKTKVNLYQLIQQRCDRPALFWWGFRCIVIDSIPGEGGIFTLEEMIKLDEADRIFQDIKIGFLNPQEWCDDSKSQAMGSSFLYPFI